MMKINKLIEHLLIPIYYTYIYLFISEKICFHKNLQNIN